MFKVQSRAKKKRIVPRPYNPEEPETVRKRFFP